MQTAHQTPASPELLPLGGSRPLPAEEVRARVAAGARLVRFEWCVSALFFTLRRQSGLYLTHSRLERSLRGLGFSLAALLLGPWGVPWGLLWTPWAVWVNLTGGIDETDATLTWLDTRDKPDSHPTPPDSHHRDNRR
jgi:hypothetical protein